MSESKHLATNSIWLTWESQVRNESMAKGLGIELVEFRLPKSKFSRYAVGIARTIALLFARKPDVVFAPNPSLILTILLLVSRPIFRYRFISDAHYGGVQSGSDRNVKQRILNWIHKSANFVIVTNTNHQDFVNANGGDGLICQDPFPSSELIDAVRSEPVSVRPKCVAFICSFDQDEPYENVFEAFERLVLEDDFSLLVTGNYLRVGIEPADYPHVQFLGYVDRIDYYRVLRDSELIIDLTTNDNCLVCGAYEGVVFGTPLVLSDTEATREYFREGVVYSGPDSNQIRAAIEEAYGKQQVLQRKIVAWHDIAASGIVDRLTHIQSMAGLN